MIVCFISYSFIMTVEIKKKKKSFLNFYNRIQQGSEECSVSQNQDGQHDRLNEGPLKQNEGTS